VDDFKSQEAMRCGSCGKETTAKSVNMTMWMASGLVVIEGVPAQVCEDCQEQYYDEATSSRIHQLVLTGFPRERMVREISVPVFSFDKTPVEEKL
jgi:YgiT-type zinc finger domain-containing protein